MTKEEVQSHLDRLKQMNNRGEPLDHDDMSLLFEIAQEYLDNTVPKDVLTLFATWKNLTGLSAFGMAYQEVMAGTFDGPHLQKAKELLADRQRLEQDRKDRIAQISAEHKRNVKSSQKERLRAYGALTPSDYPRVAREAAERYASRFAFEIDKNKSWVESGGRGFTLYIYELPLPDGTFWQYGRADFRKKIIMQLNASIDMDTSVEAITQGLLNSVGTIEPSEVLEE